MKVFTKCPFCKKFNVIDMSDKQYNMYLAFKHGTGNIQDMLPDLSDTEREMLLTGICGDCWNGMFPPEEEEEEITYEPCLSDR